VDRFEALGRLWILKVKQLAQTLEVSPDTVRYYTRIGFLTPVTSHSNGYKKYRDADIERLRFILGARHLGFSVKDIKKIMAEADKGNSACPLVRELISRRMEETEKRFEDTLALRNKMKAALKQWASKPDKVPTGNMVCHLIEDFTN